MEDAYKSYAIPISTKGIVFEEKKIWLRKNERNEWELPGGKLDKGEQPEQAVKRELREELGFEVEVVALIQAYALYRIDGFRDEKQGVLIVSYACKLIRKSGDFEHISEAGKAEFKVFQLEEIANLNMPLFYKDAINKATQAVNSNILHYAEPYKDENQNDSHY